MSLPHSSQLTARAAYCFGSDSVSLTRSHFVGLFSSSHWLSSRYYTVFLIPYSSARLYSTDRYKKGEGIRGKASNRLIARIYFTFKNSLLSLSFLFTNLLKPLLLLFYLFFCCFILLLKPIWMELSCSFCSFLRLHWFGFLPSSLASALRECKWILLISFVIRY